MFSVIVKLLPSSELIILIKELIQKEYNEKIKIEYVIFFSRNLKDSKNNGNAKPILLNVFISSIYNKSDMEPTTYWKKITRQSENPLERPVIKDMAALGTTLEETKDGQLHVGEAICW